MDMDSVITKKELLNFVNSFPDDSYFWGYEGEIAGICGQSVDGQCSGYITNQGLVGS